MGYEWTEQKEMVLCTKPESYLKDKEMLNFYKIQVLWLA